MVCSKQHGAVKMLAAQQRCQQQKLYCRYRLRDIRRLRCQIVLRCRSRFGALASRSAASLRGWGGISSPLEPKQRHWFCHEVHGWFLILVVQVSYVLEGFRAIRGGWPIYTDLSELHSNTGTIHSALIQSKCVTIRTFTIFSPNLVVNKLTPSSL